MIPTSTPKTRRRLRLAAATAAAFLQLVALPASADSAAGHVSTGASQASAASAAGVSGAATFSIGTVVPGPVGGALQEGALGMMEEARNLGRAAGENLSGPLPVTPRTVTAGPRPDQVLQTDAPRDMSR